jgi:hypothetical protein
MQSSPARRPVAPPAGIYEEGGTLHGLRCLFAYDHDGEFTLRTIEPGTSDAEAMRQLEEWLTARGVTLLPSRAGLSLV